MPTFPRDSREGEVPDATLFLRAQAGDEAAWRELFAACYEKVQRVVRHKLGRHSPLRRYVDSTDIASDVFGDLASRAAGFQFGSVDEVRAFLINAAYQRVIDVQRRHSSQKRDARREQRFADDPAGGDWGISSGEPTPSQNAVAQETDQLLLDASADPATRRILELRREQYSNEEIAEITGWSVRTVQRHLEKVRTMFVA